MNVGLLVCRLVVGLSFITYGVVKLLGGQFTSGDWVIDSRTTDPTSLVWCFYGYSPVYARFIGLCELIPGLLLLLPRTRTLGAAALFPVSLNITVMDFCFGFPSVKYFSLLLTVLSFVLLIEDFTRLKIAFWDDCHPKDLAKPAVLLPERTRRRSAVPASVAWLLGIGIALPLVNLTAVATTAGPEEAALKRCQEAGWQSADLQVQRWWRTKGDWGIAMEAYVELQDQRQAPGSVIRVQLTRPHGFASWRGDELVIQK